jgi:hypothetical protein
MNRKRREPSSFGTRQEDITTSSDFRLDSKKWQNQI